jgi:phosphoglycerate dehydrogenase-like enzyme
MAAEFRVGLTRDFLGPDGRLAFGDIGLSLLDQHPGLSWEFLAEDTRELRADQVEGFDALIVLGPRVTGATLAGQGQGRLAIVARFGVGYDTVDVEACTREGVLLTLTPDGVRRPVAVAAVTLILALSHNLLIKDRQARLGKWSERMLHMGTGLTDRVLGVIGLGNIGRELCALARPFGLRLVGYDPHVDAETAERHGVLSVPLERLMAESDFVCVCCALTPETHHLLDARAIALMKTSACVINVARGPIIEQTALVAALQQGRIRGAGLDVFETEPVAADDPLLTLENVVLAPHSLCWTDECFRGNGMSACRSVLDVAAGKVPGPVVNREVVESPRLVEKLKAITQRRAGAGS